MHHRRSSSSGFVRSATFLIAAWILALPCPGSDTIRIPDSQLRFLNDYCLDCHDKETMKGEILLESEQVVWGSHDANAHWERVFKAVSAGEMPPPKKRNQPTAEERKAFVDWIDQSLTTNTRIGGTVARRLSRDEYRNTIKSLFGFRFELPPGFPADTESHGFDNIGEALNLSPPLLSAYAEAASLVADQLFPPERPPAEPATYEIPANDMVISYSSGSIRDGAMRIVSRCDSMMRSCTWPSKVEVKASGIYDIEVTVSEFERNGESPLILKVLARDVSSTDGLSVGSLRVLKEIPIDSATPRKVRFEAPLFEGQTVVFYYANAPLVSDRDAREELADVFSAKFQSDPRYLAAWQQMVKSSDQGFRGGVGWERVKALMADANLDLTEATMDSTETETLLKRIRGNPVLFTETIAYDHFENGPAINVHHCSISGPKSIIEGPKDLNRKQLANSFLGARNQRSDASWTREILNRFLQEAFRRPVDDKTVEAYAGLVEAHWKDGHSFEEGFHLAIRTALISPRFLYRSLTPGRLDDFDLASRLSYFLKGKPPTLSLRNTAAKGRLSQPDVLKRQAAALLPRKANDPFIESFTGQWLDTRLLAEIMPDPRLKFSQDDQKNARLEVETFFHEMLEKNRPLTDFIDPDFTYTSPSIAKKIYGINKGYNAKKKSLQRISMERGGRYGGLLGQAAILMATANGVDTQPVLRGVWVLENIIGNPPPPPPMAVPAITPDTTGAKTPRDLLNAHASDSRCAGCHRKIDPIGFALENFDAVGRWRTHYPIYKADKKGRLQASDGPAIDSSGSLPDGTPIRDITDLKSWLVENVDQFAECLSEKLMTYATGRVPNYVERKEIKTIVQANLKEGKGFQDLLLDLIASETFRTK